MYGWKSIIKISVILFKQQKLLFKQYYQTSRDLTFTCIGCWLINSRLTVAVNSAHMQRLGIKLAKLKFRHVMFTTSKFRECQDTSHYLINTRITIFTAIYSLGKLWVVKSWIYMDLPLTTWYMSKWWQKL